MDTSAVIIELQKNTAALEWHGGILYFFCGLSLGLLFIGLVAFAFVRGR